MKASEGGKYGLGLVEKVFERQSRSVGEGDRVAKQIKRGGQRNEKLKE